MKKQKDFNTLYMLLCLFLCSIALLSACSKDSRDIRKQLDKELLRMSGISEQDLYYWYDHRKIPLEINGFTITVRSKLDASELEHELNRLLKDDLSDFVYYEEANHMVITSKVHFGDLLQRKDMNLQRLFEQMIPCFFAGSSPVILTGELILEPGNEHSTASILEEYNNQLLLTRTTTYNTALVKVKQLSSVLRIGNNIYERGMADWCHPNFIAPVELYSTHTERLQSTKGLQFGQW